MLLHDVRKVLVAIVMRLLACRSSQKGGSRVYNFLTLAYVPNESKAAVLFQGTLPSAIDDSGHPARRCLLPESLQQLIDSGK